MMRLPPGHTERPTGSAVNRGVVAKIYILNQCISIATILLICTEPPTMFRVRCCLRSWGLKLLAAIRPTASFSGASAHRAPCSTLPERPYVGPGHLHQPGALIPSCG